MHISINKIVLFTRVACAIGIFSCATQRPPSGGPVDTTPPVIIETNPLNKAINFNKQSFSFTFSKYVDRQSVENNLHVSPIITAPLTYDWSGKTFEVTFPNPLRPKTTYVLTIGTDVVDLHNRNKMARSFTLAVSTGDSIDQGYTKGSVITENPAGVSIFGYNLESRNADTLNPSRTLPDFVVQSSSDGSFEFNNITPGLYRFFAVRDKLKDNIYDIQTDEFGVLPYDIQVKPSDSLCKPMQFQLSTEDTTRPRLQSVEGIDEHHVLIKFSEPIQSYLLPVSRIHITDSLSQKEIPVLAMNGVAQKPSQLVVTTTLPFASTKYFLSADSIQDNSNNLIMKSDERSSFSGGIEKDTIKPIIIATIPSNNETGVIPDSSIKIFFNDAIDTNAVQMTLADTSKKQLIIQKQNLSSSIISIRSKEMLTGNKYSICIAMPTIIKISNQRKMGDSLYCFSFVTQSEKEIGTLEGIVTDAENSTDNIFVEASQIDVTKVKKFKTLTAKKGAFSFEKLPQGKYILRAFVDSNKNEVLDAGKPFPFKPSERFGVLKDTVRVRAQWATRDVHISIP